MHGVPTVYDPSLQFILVSKRTTFLLVYCHKKNKPIIVLLCWEVVLFEVTLMLLPISTWRSDFSDRSSTSTIHFTIMKNMCDEKYRHMYITVEHKCAAFTCRYVLIYVEYMRKYCDGDNI